MLATLILSLALMLAQHFTYAHLDQKAVADISTSQAWISRIGTGLAFLIKVTLTIGVGSAFVQHQWMRLRQKQFNVGEVDTVTSALGNILCLFLSTIWTRYPVLATIAVICWTIPLGAVVAPGSLSVQPRRNISSIPVQVPHPAYTDSYQYGSFRTDGAIMYENSTLARLATYAAASSMPVPLQSAYQNQSYSLVFNGPAVKCSSANDTVIRNATSSFGYMIGGMSPNETPAQFLAWTPGSAGNIDLSSRDAARIFVMTNPADVANTATDIWHETVNTTGTDASSGREYYTIQTRVNVTECLLYNATYDVRFDFRYPNQTRNINITDWIAPLPAIPWKDQVDQYTIPVPTGDHFAYTMIMSAFGRLLVGYSDPGMRDHHARLHVSNSTGYNNLDVDWFHAEAIQAGLQEFFQNFTLSLLSDDGLIKNHSVAEFVTVDVETWPTMYIYNQLDLFLAYGLSLLAALICSGIGMYAFIVNDASYQNIFSTYLRAVGGGLDHFIVDGDRGEDPLPKDVKNVKVDLGSGCHVLR